MERTEALQRISTVRTGHLATLGPDAGPHIVVVTFALFDDHIVTAIDHKPKRTQLLRRIRNIETNPAVSFLADHYEENWDRLWWVRVDGTASIWSEGESRHGAVAALVDRYDQYRGRPPAGPVIAISIDRVSGWKSAP